ncbi:MAG TPA: cation-translocating P-type ATPase [Clostridia bacterium]|nr:cation-translocating P-type ATPase [Clostridia bacterium]
MSTCCKIEHKKERFYETIKYQIIALSVSLVALILSFLWGKIIGTNTILVYFNTGWIAVILCGFPLAVAAFENLFKFKKIKSSLLITVALVACVVLEILNWSGVTSSSHGNYLFAAGEVAFLMMLGGLIEDLTVKRSRSGIEKLINLAPKTANILMQDKFVSMPINFVQIGDIVLVKPYEQIPVDGVVAKGLTSVNQSAITGESEPIDKTAGDTVYAGTWNNSGAVEIKVTKTSTETTLAKMVELVKQAEQKKAPAVRIADKWAGVIVPIAILLAVLVFPIAYFGFNVSWTEALVRSVTVLVVFCPCALALAAPTAVAAAIGNASFHGILVKSGEALEAIGKTDIFVFDKTGTLTTGQIKVTDYFSLIDKDEFLTYLCGAESNSEHPLAKAITNFSNKKITASKTKSLVGSGVEAIVEGKKIIVAKLDYFKNHTSNEKIEEWSRLGYTVVGMSVENEFCGAVALTDTVRETAAQTVTALKNESIKSVMLTGDNAFSAKRVSEEIGIDEFYHSMLPEEKLKKVEEYGQFGKKVCMAGDGVNDAPALAAADCSVTMGAIGSDVALEVSDIAIMDDRIEKIHGLIKLSKKTLSIIKLNIIFAMTVNFVAVILSSLGLLNPVWGALVHNGTSLIVVFYSSTLLANKSFKTNKNSPVNKN